jgi:hypothetical protein
VHSAGPVRYLLADASWEVTVLNVEFNCVPRVITAVMIATEMPAAIRPYSMAVAADSSSTKRVMRLFMCCYLSSMPPLAMNMLRTNVFLLPTNCETIGSILMRGLTSPYLNSR